MLRPVHECLVAHDCHGEKLLLQELVPDDGPELLHSKISHQCLDAALTPEVKLGLETGVKLLECEVHVQLSAIVEVNEVCVLS